jgi:hypothetical protein
MTTTEAKLFFDKNRPGIIRVEFIDDDGGCEVAIFDGPRARERAERFASSFYGTFDDRTKA